MSRIGKLPISIPSGVTVKLDGNVVTVKGPKGELTQKIDDRLDIDVKENEIIIENKNQDNKELKAQHGLARALVHNMVVGVSEGFKATLELVGVGYRATNTGNTLELSLGFTHVIYMQLPPEVKVETKMERNKNPFIMLECPDKQLLGQICAKIRSYRKPEPYKGKGVKFEGEYIRRKSGKVAGK